MHSRSPGGIQEVLHLQKSGNRPEKSGKSTSEVPWSQEVRDEPRSPGGAAKSGVTATLRIVDAACYIYRAVEHMSRHDALGEFEHAVLAAVAHLDEAAYGVTIRREIESRTRRHVSIGALYTALDRLERKGYVTSTMSDPTPRRGGRSKRHFRLTSTGSGALQDSRDFLQRMWAGLALTTKRGRA